MRGVKKNLWNDTISFGKVISEKSPLFEEPWRLLMTIIITGLIILTVFGNFVTLVAIFKLKTLKKSVSNLFIASLAAADMIVGGFVMTFMMIYTVANGNVWYFGPVFCDIWQVVDMSSCTTSLYSILAITFDRWWHLEKPLRIFKRNHGTIKKILILIWLIPVLVWLPTFAGLRLMQTEDELKTAEYGCHVVWRPKFIVPMLAVPMLYLPVIVLIILIMRISFVIRTHLNFLSIHSNHRKGREKKSNFILDQTTGLGQSDFIPPVKKLSLSVNYNKRPEELDAILMVRRHLSYESIAQDLRENMSCATSFTNCSPKYQTKNNHHSSTSSLEQRRTGSTNSPLVKLKKLAPLQEVTTSSSQSSGIHLKPYKFRNDNSRSMTYLETTSAIIEQNSKETSFSRTRGSSNIGGDHQELEFSLHQHGQANAKSNRPVNVKHSSTFSDFQYTRGLEPFDLETISKPISCHNNLSWFYFRPPLIHQDPVDCDYPSAFYDQDVCFLPLMEAPNINPMIDPPLDLPGDHPLIHETEAYFIDSKAPDVEDCMEPLLDHHYSTKIRPSFDLDLHHASDKIKGLADSDETEENILRALAKTKKTDSLSRKISVKLVATKLPLEIKRSVSDDLIDDVNKPFRRQRSSFYLKKDKPTNAPILRKISLGQQPRSPVESPTKKLTFDFSQEALLRNAIASKRNILAKEKTTSMDSRRSSGLSFSSIFAMFSSKRDSCASDTAFVYTRGQTNITRRFQRSKTEVTIQVEGKDKSQCVSGRRRSRSKRFSIISIGSNVLKPLKRGSMGFFTDFFPHSGKNGSFAQQVRAGKAVGLILSLFLICWLPFLILWPIRTYCKECVSDTVYALAMWANYLNSAVNPIIYTLCSPRFRRALKENWSCRKCKDCDKSPFNSSKPVRKKLTPSSKQSPLLVPVKKLKCDYV